MRLSTGDEMLSELNHLSIENHDNCLGPLEQRFASPYFQKLYSKLKLPIKFQEFQPSSICKFLSDLADSYVVSLTKNTSLVFCKKLDQHFFVVCMLNALFGDPRVHLHQKHPAYQGDKMRVPVDNYNDTKQSVETGKQRRNAVSQLMRFICKNEWQVKLEDNYKTVYLLLLNGQVVEAARLLSRMGKHNLAMIVSQAVSA